MRHKIVSIPGFAGLLLLMGFTSAQTTSYDVQFPTGLRDWFEVNSMIVTKDSPIFGQLGGMHLIHVNATGLPTLKSGGPLPYPDGTILADDVHEFSVKDGSYVEGSKKAIAVMVKDEEVSYDRRLGIPGVGRR
jgi:hypothetical protein